MDEILDITLYLAATFERLGIPYAVGGSLASSLHGLPRSTQDVDIVVRMSPSHVPDLAAALRKDFYLDEDAMREAAEHRTSFNVIHLGSYFKADIFVAKDDEASCQQMARRQRFDLGGDRRREIVVASPEDTVAHKLYWFSLGQWADAIGVLKVAGRQLDMPYLRRMAALLGVETLLARACAEANIEL